MDIVSDRDIRAQQTCHMLQKLPLSLSSRSFVSLNVTQTFFWRVSHGLGSPFPTTPFIVAYMNRPPSLEALNLLEAAHSWSFSTCRKHNQWKQINPCKIVHFLPFYCSIPSLADASYTSFCWSEAHSHQTLASLMQQSFCIRNKKDMRMFHVMFIEPLKSPLPYLWWHLH